MLVPSLFEALYHPSNVYLVHFDKRIPADVVEHWGNRILIRGNSSMDAAGLGQNDGDVHVKTAHQPTPKRERERSNVHILHRELIQYRGVSLVVGVLEGMQAALRLLTGIPWDYFINISGSHYPTVTPQVMRQILGALACDDRLRHGETRSRANVPAPNSGPTQHATDRWNAGSWLARSGLGSAPPDAMIGESREWIHPTFLQGMRWLSAQHVARLGGVQLDPTLYDEANHTSLSTMRRVDANGSAWAPVLNAAFVLANSTDAQDLRPTGALRNHHRSLVPFKHESWMIVGHEMVSHLVRSNSARRTLVSMAQAGSVSEHFFGSAMYLSPLRHSVVVGARFTATFWPKTGPRQHPLDVDNATFFDLIRKKTVLFVRKFVSPDAPTRRLINSVLLAPQVDEGRQYALHVEAALRQTVDGVRLRGSWTLPSYEDSKAMEESNLQAAKGV